MAVFVLMFFICSVSSLCVHESSTHLYCVTELYFDDFFGNIEKLTIVHSFINEEILRSKFPYVQEVVVVQSDYLVKQCEILYENELKVQGCESGMRYWKL